MVFPVNVPNVPGVPPVFRTVVNQVIPAVLTGDLVPLFTGLGYSLAWGLYYGGAPIVVADTITAMDYRQMWAQADFPIEGGGFESYNKVQVPFEGRFRFTAGGSTANKQIMLDSIAAIAGTLDLYDLVTPEAVYTRVNVSRYDYHRTATSGLGLLHVDVYVQEIREATAFVSLSSTASPASAGTTNTGTVQTSPATPSQAAKAPIIGANGQIAGGI